MPNPGRKASHHLKRRSFLPAAWVCALFLACGLANATKLAADPFTLADARALAKTSSDGLKALDRQVDKAKFDVTRAASNLFPRINFAASGSWLANPAEGLTVGRGELGTFSIPGAGSFAMPDKDIEFMPGGTHAYVKIGATLTQPILTWGRLERSIDLARLQVQASAADLGKAERDIDRETKRAYHAALLTRESLPVVARLAELAKAISAKRLTAYSLGSVTQESVAEADATTASIASKLDQTRESLYTALASLAFLTGRDIAAEDLVMAFRTELPELDEAALLRQALANSRELVLTRLRLDQAKKKVELARADSPFLPNLGLTINAGVSGQKLPLVNANWTDTWNWDVTISVGTTIKLLDSGENLAAVGAASADAQSVDASLRQQERKLTLDLRRAVEAARKAASDLQETRARSIWLTLRAQNVQTAYEAEAAAQSDADGAKLQAEGSILDLLLARYRLEEALCDIETLVGVDFP